LSLAPLHLVGGTGTAWDELILLLIPASFLLVGRLEKWRARIKAARDGERSAAPAEALPGEGPAEAGDQPAPAQRTESPNGRQSASSHTGARGEDGDD